MPPTLRSAPVLKGTGKIGTVVTLVPGSWDGNPVPQLTFQWQRNGRNISGATKGSYTPVAADDATNLGCIVTATNVAGTAKATARALKVTYPAPKIGVAPGDVTFEQGSGEQVVDIARVFIGGNLRITASGAGAVLDASRGVLRIPTSLERTAQQVSLSASNSGGTAGATFRVTVARRAVAPFVVTQPVLTGSGRIGSPVAVDPGIWGGEPAPTLSLQWQRNGTDIPGATGVSYLPGSGDDRTTLQCLVRATNRAGAKTVAAGPLAVSHLPPRASGSLPDQVFRQSEGAQFVPTAQDFTGEALVFSVEGGGAVIDPVTGVVVVPLEAVMAGETVTVSAENSGGIARSAFQVTVEAAVLPEGGVKLWLVDPVADTRRVELAEGLTVDPAIFPGGEFTIEAVVDPALRVGSVRFHWGDLTRVESAAPFALFGDTNGDFTGKPVPLGVQEVGVELFSGGNASGVKLGSIALAFAFEAEAVPPQEPPAPDAFLVTAVSDKPATVTVNAIGPVPPAPRVTQPAALSLHVEMF